MVGEPLRHLTGSVLGSLQRMIQEALRCGGYHRGNERSDSSRCLCQKTNVEYEFDTFLIIFFTLRELDKHLRGDLFKENSYLKG